MPKGECQMKIVYWDKLAQAQQKQILSRITQSNEVARQQTQEIIERVKIEQDTALYDYTAQFDNAELKSLTVTEREFATAYTKISQDELAAIKQAIKRIADYQQSQLPENSYYDSQDGVLLARQARAINKVGLYVPAGTAPLISTVLMLAVPAKVAGCVQRIICTPPMGDGSVNPAILVAAQEAGATTVYKIGGAQAIAAMAYGTQTIPKVDKIFGPGNQWVTMAKQLCAQSQAVSIDMPAGPSEILVIGDKTCNPEFVAADLLSQAEHDVASQAIFITTCVDKANQVQACVQKQLQTLERSQIAVKALENSAIIIVDTLLQAIAISNEYAPEHLSLQMQNPEQYQTRIDNAGTVFLGHLTCEALGDYITGANHVLPTSGFAKSISGLSILDFMKWVGFQTVTEQGLANIGPTAVRLANMEQLQGHAQAVTLRLKEVNNVSST